MMKVRVNKREVSLNPKLVIGKGGEADIYRLGNDLALKIFKDRSHPDLSGQPDAQKAAMARLQEQQSKLPQFPSGFLDEVVSPIDLATHNKSIVGYTMKLIKQAEPIMMYSKRGFRSQGVSELDVLKIFRNLRNSLVKIHQNSVVVGDFNDLNILVKGNKPYFIDVDSWQYRGFLTQVFTAKFLDPLLAQGVSDGFYPNKMFGQESDWYAFATMFFQSLLFVDPYGGVFRPKNKDDRLIESLRPHKRITVFHPDVRYPKPARHFKVLPDDLLHYFEEIFVHKKREVFLDTYFDLEWKTCSKCGKEYARSACPDCVGTPDQVIKESIIVQGQAKIRSVFKTKGIILFADFQNGLKYLEHENGNYYREGKRKILSGALLAGMRYRLQGRNTLLGQGSNLLIIKAEGDVKKQTVDALNNLSMFDANKENVFFLLNGGIYRQDDLVPVKIGESLSGQTLFWAGDKIGFGFYRAGLLSEAFVFSVGSRGLKYVDNFQIPSGQIIDSTCFLSDAYVWFFVSSREQGIIKNYCFLYANDGRLLGQAQGEQNDGSWLGEIRGKIALGNFLLSCTDDGIVRIENQSGQVTKTKIFSDTERYVQADSHILAGDNGLYIVGRKTINHIELI